MITVNELNPISDEMRAIREQIDHSKPVWLADQSLVKITRLRLLSDPGLPFWDLSYCYGELADGTPVRVILPRAQFSKRHLSRDLVEMCKSVKRYGKGLGVLDAVSWVN